MSLKIATWNVNSIKARLPNVLDWLEEAKPDVALLQEIKTVDENFPVMEIEERGYNCAIHGQKSYNGVAILSKHPLSDVTTGLPSDDADEQARYVEAWVEAGDDSVRVASIYLPNGNPVDTDKYPYKLQWMDRLAQRAASLLHNEAPVVLGGDYNVIPADGDCYDPAAWAEDALFKPETRAKFRTLLNLGYTEAWRTLHNEQHVYSFWDYQAGAWQKDNGIRIDHLLLSPQAADRLVACEIDKGPRGKTKASDHTPVWCELTA
ncbi:MAG: exodeoxyribonuclease III [Alphaproteobacteria bacterium]